MVSTRALKVDNDFYEWIKNKSAMQKQIPDTVEQAEPTPCNALATNKTL